MPRYQFITDNNESQTSNATAASSDATLLDAYSQTVVGVSQAIGPAVIGVGGANAQRSQGGFGSGVIVSPDGLALTNSHVVAGRSALVARTHEGDRIDTSVIGDDPSTDLALLRLSSRDLPYARLETARPSVPGQMAIALGSPFGLHSTVTAGIVSAIGRSLRGRDGRLIDDVVQHTAPINPGNSGGPLLDSRGRVVGINTAIIVMAQGLGFAVSSATAEWVISEFLQHGRVRRLRLGIAAGMARLPQRTRRILDILNETAVQVLGVEEGSAAERAGILPEDLIVSINGRLVENVDDVHRLLSHLESDAQVIVGVVRGQSKIEFVIRPPGGGNAN